MTPRSLRLRLVFAWGVFIVLLLQVAAVGLRVLFERSITRRTQLELAADLRQIKRGMTVAENGTVQIVREPTDPQFDIVFGGRYWQVAEGGQILVRSRSLKDERLSPLAASGNGKAKNGTWLLGPDQQRLLAVIEEFTPSSDVKPVRRLTITTAVDATEINEDTDKFASELWTSLAVLATLLLGGAFAHVTIGLRPLEELRSRLAAVRRGQASQIEGEFPSEIMPLVSETNELLSAQQSALTMARQRAGDLAHGLNTPLAVMNAKSRQLRRAGQAEIAGEIEHQVEIMRRHVERELARARARGGSRTSYGRIDAARLLDPLISALQGLPRGQDLDWRVSVPVPFHAFVDADDFNNIAGNLLENALKWTKTVISVEAHHNGQFSVLTIEDDGPGIPEDEIPRILMRGERADTTIPGTGLGLAIVCDLVELYGGKLNLGSSQLGGLKAELLFPERPLQGDE